MPLGSNGSNRSNFCSATSTPTSGTGTGGHPVNRPRGAAGGSPHSRSDSVPSSPPLHGLGAADARAACADHTADGGVDYRADSYKEIAAGEPVYTATPRRAWDADACAAHFEELGLGTTGLFGF